eukprot:TRINITY_DN12817_c0_g2_i1.p1 TRINITY_DN12817_c0_g2~~TRINITY_DN12817_c0_g2_i1.p1  ORF type:complete len:531 (+),score=86.87 TRINITY_DN12817_c0_g2_i1:1661-3253(+)
MRARFFPRSPHNRPALLSRARLLSSSIPFAPQSHWPSSQITVRPLLAHFERNKSFTGLLQQSSPIATASLQLASTVTNRDECDCAWDQAGEDFLPVKESTEQSSLSMLSEEAVSFQDAVESTNKNALIVASFYKFADLPDYAEMRQPVKEFCEANFISGGIILAPEGINGSICGRRGHVQAVFAALRKDERLEALTYREAPASSEDEKLHEQEQGPGHLANSPLSPGPNAPFRWDHVRVKLKKEVVSMGVPGVEPHRRVGKYVAPEEWNALISQEDTLVVDVRNHYETRIGSFKGAVDPRTDSFREFPAWVDERLQPPPNLEEGHQAEGSIAGFPRSLPAREATDFREDGEGNSAEDSWREGEGGGEKLQPKRVAMFCTGGIRCEKATSFMLDRGFTEVYHLEGGILRYLEEVEPKESLWEGECFVFDKRVAVREGLRAPGTYRLCYACKEPVDVHAMQSPLWEEGVSCPYCHGKKSEEERERARERQRQFEAWGAVGGPHGGKRENKLNKNERHSPTLRRQDNSKSTRK